MATSIDLLKPLRIYKTKLRYPLGLTKDKLTGSLVFIMSNTLDKTISFLKNNSFLINNGNYFRCFYTEKEFMYIMDESGNRFKGDSIIHSVIESASGESDTHINNIYLKLDKPGDLSAKVYFPEAVENLIFNEDYGTKQNYPMIFRQMLYADRIKNQKELTAVYKKVKSEVDWIKYTYPSLKQYKNKNLIVDLSYYTNIFLNKNIYQLDKAVDIFHHLMNKMIKDNRYNGYNRRTVILPISAWINDGDIKTLFDYRKNINPFSMIGRLVKTKKVLNDYWNGIDFIICSDNAYFKVDFSNFSMKELYKFIILTGKLVQNDIGDAEEAPEDEESIEERKAEQKETPTVYSEPEKVPAESNDEEWVKAVVSDLQAEPVNKLSESRIKRMEELDKSFDNTEFNGKKVGTVLNNYYSKPRVLKDEKIPIKNINEEWNEIKSLNFNREYDIDEDILAIFKSFRFKSRPLSVVSIKMEDTSTYEDYVYTIYATLEDINGTRSSIQIDIPKFIENRFMKLRGNTKSINGELLLLPIIKTDENTAQIVTSYRKIFISRVNPSGGTKSTKAVSKLTKALGRVSENPKTHVKIFEGDNSFTCARYDLPIEYRDLAGIYTKITMRDGSYISFDYEKSYDLLEQFNPTEKWTGINQIPIGYDGTKKKTVIGHSETIASDIAEFICSKDSEFAETYAACKPSDKLSYSEASIMTTHIPVIVLMAYSEGLQKAMDKAKIKYRFSEKRSGISDDESYIKFKDGYIIYNDKKPEDSLLMTGLVKCDLSDYSIKEINQKSMWLDMLDNFGGRLKADGLDNFYDCEFDPMSIDICKKYDLPYDYIEALAYASGLLANTKYNKHSDITGNRVRTNEIVAGYLYQEMCKSYGEYATKSKRVGKGVKFTIKKSAVIDALMKDPGFSDFSVNNPILEAEAINTLSFKGLSGMNSDRAYTLDKRIYDTSMIGVLSMSTGFANTVGIARQATVNASIADTRGIIKTNSVEDLNTLNTLSIYEALAPYGVTHDDPIRVAMGFTQTKAHQMRTKSSDPNLITYGMDEALPYFTSNIFSYKFKGEKGRVIAVDEEFIVYEEVDKNGKKSRHMIDMHDKTMKNSDGGFYVTLHLVPCVKKGDILKYNDILAYDPTSYSKAVGTTSREKTLSYNIGTLAKVAILTTDEAYEDSSIITERLSDALTSFYCVEKDCSIGAQSNVFYISKVGQEIQEGESLIVFQEAFEDNDANILLKNISKDDETIELANDFGRIQVRSKLTGVIQDIKIYRTCDLKDMSSSLRRIVSEYEKAIETKKEKLLRNGVSKLEIDSMIEPNIKSKQEGKLKNLNNGVMFCFYIKCTDKMGVGDKLVYNTAIKGVVKDIISVGKEPSSEYRKDEPVDALLTTSAVNARMVGSILNGGALTKVMVELTRQCKDILGIKWENLKNKDNLN